jgi:hypothetical protein
MISNINVFRLKEDLWMLHIFSKDILEEIDAKVEG